MLTDIEGYIGDNMLRPLSKIINRRCIQQQLYMKALSAAHGQTTPMSSSSNPQNLPRLPVPDLGKTLAKYLQSVKPFLDEKELACTRKRVEDFCDPNGVGVKLQEYLLKRAKCTVNWLEDWWLDVAYLGFRQPVVVYSSPGQAFPFQKFECEEARLAYAAKLILAAVSYKMLIDAKKLPIDKMGKNELDMNQYNKILGTCRIPAMPSDCLQYNSDSDHIVVVRNNQFFKVKVLSNCNPLSEKQILQNLRSIIEQSDQVAPAVGVLTSDCRDIWAKNYETLIKDDGNRQSVEEIQKSLFLVCFDAPMPEKGCDNRQTRGGKQLIHGGGSCGNAGNRWYDKTVQFVLGNDGIVGLTYEHSPSEGQPIAVMVDYLVNFIKKDEAQKIPDAGCAPSPKPLCFKLNDEIQCAIDNSNKNIDKLADNLELSCFTFKQFGKEFVKSQKLSPDSFIQIALQYTFYKIHKEPGAHYESAATRLYVGGRTETIRSCSVESVCFAKAMLDCSASTGDKLEALKKAIDGHKKYSVDAVQGFGVDRHLLGLKLAAKQLGCNPPALYNDPSYTRSTHMRISSSQVATKCDGFMCYGPITDDGYGCCYNPRANDINIAVSAFKCHPDTNAETFRQALEVSLCEMQEVLMKSQKSKM